MVGDSPDDAVLGDVLSVDGDVELLFVPGVPRVDGPLSPPVLDVCRLTLPTHAPTGR